eukprot:5228384-Ditylum_brightwellii.AAC.1
MAKNMVAYCGAGGAPMANWVRAAFVSMFVYIGVASAVNKMAPGGSWRLTNFSLRILESLNTLVFVTLDNKKILLVAKVPKDPTVVSKKAIADGVGYVPVLWYPFARN